MTRFRQYLFTAIIAVPLAAGAQSPTGATATSPTQSPTAPGANQSSPPMASTSAIKILSPKAGEKLTTSALSFSFELLNNGISAAGSPTYRLQLDSRDPVETTSTEHTFSGLASGKHVLTVEVVDANHIPIMGSQTQVQFSVSQPPAAGTTEPPPNQQQAPPQPQAEPRQQSPRAELLPPSVRKATLPLPAELPSAGGELPLLSMVGFGVLIGGVISAMRTRR